MPSNCSNLGSNQIRAAIQVKKMHIYIVALGRRTVAGLLEDVTVSLRNSNFVLFSAGLMAGVIKLFLIGVLFFQPEAKSGVSVE